MLRGYSYLRVSTGFRRAARLAGMVPKMTPTRTEESSAITAEYQVMGIVNGVKSLTEKGMARPMRECR